MELPIALGKTISERNPVADPAKTPLTLLMAGATGQGKISWLNVVLTSLYAKKHPAEVKFVLVDPKSELTLFNKIERHYLAKLPDTEDAINNDNAKQLTLL